MKKEQIEDLKTKYKAYLFDDVLEIMEAKNLIDESEFYESLDVASIAYGQFELFAKTLMEE